MQDSSQTHPRINYFGVYFALLALSAVTVGVVYVHMPPTIAVIVAVIIATTKATLVGMYFMHLKYEVKGIYIVVGVPLVLSIVMILALLPDIALRVLG